MPEEAVSEAASICVYLEELQIREDEKSMKGRSGSLRSVMFWAVVTFIVQRAVMKLNPPTAMNVDHDLYRDGFNCRWKDRGGGDHNRSVWQMWAWPQGTINGRWVFNVRNSPTALNVQQDQQKENTRGSASFKFLISTLGWMTAER